LLQNTITDLKLASHEISENEAICVSEVSLLSTWSPITYIMY